MPNIHKPTSIQDEWLKKAPKSIKVGNEIFDEVPRSAVIASSWLTSVWQYLGRPDSPLTPSGEKMMKVVVSLWEDLFPEDSKEWYEARQEYKANELDISQQIARHTGRSLASYPFFIFQIMKKLFPNFKLGDRKNVLKLVKKYPMFQMANKV